MKNYRSISLLISLYNSILGDQFQLLIHCFSKTGLFIECQSGFCLLVLAFHNYFLLYMRLYIASLDSNSPVHVRGVSLDI